jgi:signal transduction histidine kinase
LVLKKHFQSKVENTRKIFEVIIQAQEQERQRIAQDIHDELGSLLTSMGIYISNIKSINYSNEKKEEYTNELVILIDKAKKEAKNASFALAPDSLIKFGLKGAINDLEVRFSAAQNIGFEIEYHCEINLALFVQLQLYRIVMELVNNAVKYAKSKTIYIDLFDKENKIFLQVKDDGIGFDIEKILNSGKANGLNHTFNRVKSLNGLIKQCSSTSCGSTFIFEFELKNLMS